MKRFLLRASVFVLVLAAVGAGSTSASLPRAKPAALREALRPLISLDFIARVQREIGVTVRAPQR
jgi:hypothetical protein